MRRLVGLLLACVMPILGQLRFMPMAEPMYVVRKPLQFMPHTAASTCALVNHCDRYRFMPRRPAGIQPRPTTQLPTMTPTTAMPLTSTPPPATTAPGATPNATTTEPSRPPVSDHPVPSASGHATTAPPSPSGTPSYENRTPSPPSESTKRPHGDAIDRPNSQSPPGPQPMQPTTDSDASLSSGAIAGIAVAAAVCVLGAAALLFAWKKKRANVAKHQEILQDHTTGSGQYFALL